MISVDSKVKAAFLSDSTFKTYTLDFPEVKTKEDKVDKEAKKIQNDEIISESITLTEPLCSEEQLKFGCCEAATFEIELAYEAESLEGRIFNAFLTLGDLTEDQYVFTVGRYVVDEEEISDDRRSKTITAYDVLYVMNNLDVTAWYYTLEFPLTIKQLRDSLFEYVNLEQVSKKLINDDKILLNTPLDGETDIRFETIITGICEWNAVFGHINRQGKFDYISLTPIDNEEVYPSETLFPAHDLYPKSIRSKNYYIDPHYIKSDITWKNYKCKTVDTVQVRNKAGAAILEEHVEIDGKKKDTYTNIYVIQSNWVTDAFDSQTLEAALHQFVEAIKDITYTPCEANIKMDLSLEVGDAITLTSTDGTRLPTYIMQRTMSGICHAFDAIEATGYEEWVNDPPDTDGAVSSLMDDLTDLSDRVDALEQGYGDGGINVLSVPSLPEAPKKNVIYLIQGRINVY